MRITVAEYIQSLKKLPQDAPVVVMGSMEMIRFAFGPLKPEKWHDVNGQPYMCAERADCRWCLDGVPVIEVVELL